MHQGKVLKRKQTEQTEKEQTEKRKRLDFPRKIHYDDKRI